MNDFRKTLKEWLLTGAVVLLLVVCLPLLAVFFFVGRVVFVAAALAALAGSLVLLLVSPRFRRRINAWTAIETHYKGLNLDAAVALHPGHVWARVNPSEVVIGADDLVQTVLGPVDSVEFPAIESRVERDHPLLVLRGGDRTIELPAPVSGTVVACNEALRRRPGLVNSGPFSEGWMVRIRGDQPWRDRRRLLRGVKAQAWFRREVDRMISLLMAGPGEERHPAGALADGGSVVEGLHRQIDEEAWKRVEKAFFKPKPTALEESGPSPFSRRKGRHG